MKKLILAILLLPVVCFAGANPVQQSPYTTNLQSGADQQVLTVASTNTSIASGTNFLGNVGNGGPAASQINIGVGGTGGSILGSGGAASTVNIAVGGASAFGAGAAVVSPGGTVKIAMGGANTYSNGLPGTVYSGNIVLDPRAKISGDGGELTNLTSDSLTGTVNPLISTNPAVVFNDLLYSTNTYLNAVGCGGPLVNAAVNSNGVVLLLGDSMTLGQANKSASQCLVDTIQSLYGNAGGYGGAVSAYSGNWNNVTPITRGCNFTNFWCTAQGILYASDGSNALNSSESQYGLGLNSNVCNSVGLVWIKQPQGGNISVQIVSPSLAITNNYVVSGLSSSNSYVATNFSVAAAADWSTYLTSQTGTNFFVSSGYVYTNFGVLEYNYSQGGISLDNMLTAGTNSIGQMFQAVNANLIIYHAKDIGEQPSGTVYSNKLATLLGFANTNALVVIVGTPPILGASYQDQNFYTRLLCQAHGWHYLDLWTPYQNFQDNTNRGLMYDGTHPNTSGAQAESGTMFNALGLPPVPLKVNGAHIAGTVSASILPSSVITNNYHAATLYGLTVNNDGVDELNVNVQQYNNQDYFQMGGWLRIWNGSGIALAFSQPITGVGSLYWNSGYGGTLNITNWLTVTGVTNLGTYYGNGSGLTNLPWARAFTFDGHVGIAITNNIGGIGSYYWLPLSGYGATANAFNFCQTPLTPGYYGNARGAFSAWSTAIPASTNITFALYTNRPGSLGGYSGISLVFSNASSIASFTYWSSATNYAQTVYVPEGWCGEWVCTNNIGAGGNLQISGSVSLDYHP